ncbi:MAG TPA: hypothetical protein VJT72_09935 [Pseudonocardiaceae bacterium]|nr:hypothetical protein [Pseudonocardiaceae bacterium]
MTGDTQETRPIDDASATTYRLAGPDPPLSRPPRPPVFYTAGRSDRMRAMDLGE